MAIRPFDPARRRMPFQGHPRPHLAERHRLWLLATKLYPGYDHYRARAGHRRIPIIVLERARRP